MYRIERRRRRIRRPRHTARALTTTPTTTKTPAVAPGLFKRPVLDAEFPLAIFVGGGLAMICVYVTKLPSVSVDVLRLVTAGGVESATFPLLGSVTDIATVLENVDSG